MLAEGTVLDRKKVQRLRRQEGRRVNVRRVRKRDCASSTAIADADAPKVVWAIDFQFDSTRDGRMLKVASMVDEHTRESLLDLTEGSITAEHLVSELDRIITTRGLLKVLRVDNGPEFISTALVEFCLDRVGIAFSPAGQPWRNGYVD